jgi:glycopeptide antibiotics resistance protein
MTTRLAAATLLAIWLVFGLLMTLQPVDPAPGQVVNDNLVLFRTIQIYLANLESPFWVGQLIGNLLLLLPVGLLGPIAFPAMNGWGRVLVVAFLLSAAIELAQLQIPNRSADVDDMLVNVFGALIGYALFRFLRLGSIRPEPVPERR